MRDVNEVVEELSCSQGIPDELIDELFWTALARGLSSGTSGWGRLFADIRGWTKSGGNNAEKKEERITENQARELVKAVLS